MDDHIAKPIDLDVVVATILRHCKAPSESNGAYETPPAAEAAARRIRDRKSSQEIGRRQNFVRRLAHDFAKDAPTTRSKYGG